MPRARDEPVRLTRIYTRAGDGGETSLGDGSRVPKLDCRIAAFGTVDEVNSLLGLALAAHPPAEMAAVLERVQNELFDVGADVSVPFGIADRLRITKAQIDALESDCDRFNADLPELKSFVLPGGASSRRVSTSPARPAGGRSATSSTRPSESRSTRSWSRT